MHKVFTLLAAWLPFSCTILLAQAVSFRPPVGSYSTGGARGATYTGIAIADFDKDGNLDIAYSSNQLIPTGGVLLGNGDGSFRLDSSLRIDGLEGPIFAADLDGDGQQDLLFAGRAAIRHGNGNGTFEEATFIENCRGIPVIADLNHDGRPDLLCLDTVLLGSSSGTFQNPIAKTQGSVQAVADFNGDGKADALIETAPDAQAIILGKGDGTFGDATLVSSFASYTSILAGDFTGDGHVDLAGKVPNDSRLIILPGKGNGTLGAGIVNPGVPDLLNTAGDLNGDGKLDIVAGDAVLAGNGDGTFRFPIFIGALGTRCTGSEPCKGFHPQNAIADFNRDGLPDIAAGYVARGLTSFSPFLEVLLNNSPGDGFSATGVSAATGDWPVGAGSIVTAFGTNLAPRTESADANAPPTTLGGIRLHLRDQARLDEWLAPLLYVSPTQINYVLDSTDPYVMVSIERVGSPYVPKGIGVPIQIVAPGLFTLGSGLAAASAVRIAADGTQTVVPVTSCVGTVCMSEPIDVSGDPVYASFFGTGFSQAAAEGSSCTIGGQPAPVLYAGPQMQFAGLDQINVLLPKALQGIGTASLVCSLRRARVPTIPAGSTNEVKLSFR